MTYGERWNRAPDAWRDHDNARTGYRARDREHPDKHERHEGHDRGYEPFGTTGRTYYGEGRSYDLDGPGRYREHGDREQRETRMQGYGDGRGGAYGSRGSYGAYGYDRGRDYGFGETGGGFSRWDREHEWGSNPRSGRGEEARSWFDKATDEVQSWMGDEDAQRRRRWDEMRAGEHRGRGPKGYRRSDERIREDVSDRLTDDDWLDAGSIEVAVKDSEVTLNGTVSSREDKRRAEMLVERCSGIDHVQNNLRVQRADYGAASSPTADSQKDARVTSSTTGRA